MKTIIRDDFESFFKTSNIKINDSWVKFASAYFEQAVMSPEFIRPGIEVKISDPNEFKHFIETGSRESPVIIKEEIHVFYDQKLIVSISIVDKPGFSIPKSRLPTGFKIPQRILLRNSKDTPHIEFKTKRAIVIKQHFPLSRRELKEIKKTFDRNPPLGLFKTRFLKTIRESLKSITMEKMKLIHEILKRFRDP